MGTYYGTAFGSYNYAYAAKTYYDYAYGSYNYASGVIMQTMHPTAVGRHTHPVDIQVRIEN